MKHTTRNLVIPVFTGIILFAIELLIALEFKSVKSIFVYAIIYMIAAYIIVKIYGRFDECGWFLMGSWGSNMLCIALILLLIPDTPIIFVAMYILLINWLAITSVCIILKLVFPKDKYANFKGFFKLSSIIFGVCYLMIMLYALFFKSIKENLNGVNLVPFSTIMSYISGKGEHLDGAMLNLIANILLFIPLGFYVGVLLRKKTMKIKLTLIFVIPIIVELIQLVFSLGICDVDDVILNALGGLCGIGVLKLIEKLYSIKKGTTKKLF